MAGAVFASYGAVLVDEEGNITVKSDATKQALDWFKRLSQSCRTASMPMTTPRTTRR